MAETPIQGLVEAARAVSKAYPPLTTGPVGGEQGEPRPRDLLQREVPRDPWVHRSAGMRCRTGMWFVLKADQVGRCRRHAPTMSGYPVVLVTDWCGDHKLDETHAP